MSDEEISEALMCPIHGDVEGITPNEGPLSDCFPYVLVCEKCDGDRRAVVVGYETPGFGIVRQWEEIPGKFLV